MAMIAVAVIPSCDTEVMGTAAFRSAAALTAEDRILVLRALHMPRGRYSSTRASQLSAVPRRTLDDWAASGALVPDWSHASPRGWSYRDVVYSRLLAWLRSKGMDRSKASSRVATVKQLLASTDVNPAVHSDGRIVLIGEERSDRFTGQQAFDGVVELLDVFHLAEPIEGVSNAELWGPSLVHPSEHTFISPWVLRGEPCVKDSRIPTAALFALNIERGLDSGAVAALYPGLSREAVEDALRLERRLRQAA
jgi:uncharacterized protein (DUF433 family)